VTGDPWLFCGLLVIFYHLSIIRIVSARFRHSKRLP